MALILVLPCVIVAVVAWMFSGTPVLNHYGPFLVGFFPLFVMFLVTSVATLRERTSGTLERVLTTSLRKGELVAGYLLAFGSLSVVQALLVTGFAVAVGMSVAGLLALVVVIALMSAVLGCALGLAASAVARTEFQAVQMMPLIIIPQLFTCGLFMPRASMPGVLYAISKVAPLTYSVEAMQSLAAGGGWAHVRWDMAVIFAWIVGSVVLGVVSLRRRTA